MVNRNGGFVPFADSESVWRSGSLEVENGTDEVVVHGSVAFRRDRVSAKRARELAAFFLSLADGISDEDCLPEEDVQPSAGVTLVANPFA